MTYRCRKKKTQTLWNLSNSEFDLFALLLINYLQFPSTSQPVIPITYEIGVSSSRSLLKKTGCPLQYLQHDIFRIFPRSFIVIAPVSPSWKAGVFAPWMRWQGVECCRTRWHTCCSLALSG